MSVTCVVVDTHVKSFSSKLKTLVSFIQYWINIFVNISRGDYLFICQCEKCVSEADEPEETSDEEDEDFDDDDDDGDQMED